MRCRLAGTLREPAGRCVAFTEAALLQLAIDFQAATDHHLRVPDSLGHPRYEGPPRRERGPQRPFVALTGPFEPVIHPG